jgi:hypothetical protein
MNRHEHQRQTIHTHYRDLCGEQRERADLIRGPAASWGFAGVAISTADLSASVWRWQRDGADRAVDNVITIPAEPAEPASLPPALLHRGRRMVSRRPGHREIWFAAAVDA